MRILPYRTVENVVDGLVVTFVDITKRKKAEEEIVRANEFTKTVINSMRDGICIINVQDSKVIDCNTAFLEDLKMKKEEVRGIQERDQGTEETGEEGSTEEATGMMGSATD